MILIDEIDKALGSGEYVIGIFLDFFSKAFDTADYGILLMKQEYYGIRGVCLVWSKSYLTKRKQYFMYNGIPLSTKLIQYGVPQGSILGLLLFYCI